MTYCALYDIIFTVIKLLRDDTKWDILKLSKNCRNKNQLLRANLNKIQKTSEEDQVIGEGEIYFDIRFSVYLGAELIKILINIEKELEKMGY